jgi:hypothetical protein
MDFNPSAFTKAYIISLNTLLYHYKAGLLSAVEAAVVV